MSQAEGKMEKYLEFPYRYRSGIPYLKCFGLEVFVCFVLFFSDTGSCGVVQDDLKLTV